MIIGLFVCLLARLFCRLFAGLLLLLFFFFFCLCVVFFWGGGGGGEVGVACFVCLFVWVFFTYSDSELVKKLAETISILFTYSYSENV